MYNVINYVLSLIIQMKKNPSCRKEQHTTCSTKIIGASISPIIFQVVIQRLGMVENQETP